VGIALGIAERTIAFRQEDTGPHSAVEPTPMCFDGDPHSCGGLLPQCDRLFPLETQVPPDGDFPGTWGPFPSDKVRAGISQKNSANLFEPAGTT